MNKIYSLFLLMIVLCLGCNSDDNGNNPNGNIVYDDWYWEFTFDTITYRCEGTYPTSVTSANLQYWEDLYNENMFSNNIYIWNQLASGTLLQAMLNDKTESSYISGDVSMFNFNIPNAPGQTANTDCRILILQTWGASITEYLNTNGVSTPISANDWGTTNGPTSGSTFNSDSDKTFNLLYTPYTSSYTPNGSLYSLTQTFGEGQASFNLYFELAGGQGYLEVPCTFSFKAPTFLTS